MKDLFAPAMPPGGAGDCAAPKLFGHAQRAGLRPLALAEFWWGTPPARPAGGDRASTTRHAGASAGRCWPTCWMGWDAEPPPLFGARPVPAAHPHTVFEDRWLVVVDKPVGLLSVPGRDPRLSDSVLSRLRARYPEASGPIVVHRLDLDTSGLMLAAKDPDTHAALQRQFLDRQVDKRYVAWLEGDGGGRGGRRSSCRCGWTWTIAPARSTTLFTASRRSPSGGCIVRRRGAHAGGVHAAHRAHPPAAGARRPRRRAWGRPSSAIGCTAGPIAA